MTVVCKLEGQDPPGYVRIFSKGADTAILPWCNVNPGYNAYWGCGVELGLIKGEEGGGKRGPDGAAMDVEWDPAIAAMDTFAHHGWRTLCFSQRLMKEADWQAWKADLEKAEALISGSNSDSKADSGSVGKAKKSGKKSAGAGEEKTAPVSAGAVSMEKQKALKTLKTNMVRNLEEVVDGFEYLGATAIEDILQVGTVLFSF